MQPGIFEEPKADSPAQLVKMLMAESQEEALPAGAHRMTPNTLDIVYVASEREIPT